MLNFRLNIWVEIAFSAPSLRLFGAHAAHPGPIGQDRLAFAAHVVVAHFTLKGVGEEAQAQAAQRLQAAAAASPTVVSTAAFGGFLLDLQQLRLQLPERRGA